MKTYQIIAKQVTYFICEIKAENLDMAKEKTENIDYDEFKELPEIDWEILEINEVTNENN